MTNTDKRDAMYYEKCLREYRDMWVLGVKMGKAALEGLEQLEEGHILRINISEIKNEIFVAKEQIEVIDVILAHKCPLEGVDLDKPNYGMFE